MPGMHRVLFFLLTGLFLVMSARAQDTLPKFSASAKGAGKILVSWHNPYQTVSQISIQRSSDSLKNFTTLLTVPDPTLPENGAMDTRASHPNYFYRLFIVLDQGKYLFTPSRRPSSVTGPPAVRAADDAEESDPVLARAGQQRVQFADPGNNRSKQQVKGPVSIKGGMPEIEVNSYVFLKRGDSILRTIPANKIRSFRDSMLNKTRDTLVFIDGDTLQIRPFIPKETYRVSSYVFTGKYGNVHLSLPEAGKKHYSVKFYDETNKLLFELLSIKTPSLIVDKTNFLHAGWFRFELYEENQLKEKNKLFIPKDF